MNHHLNVTLTQRDYLCGVCWSPLTIYTHQGETWVGCSRYKVEHKDAHFVRRSGIERTRAGSREEYLEVIEGLKLTDWYVVPTTGLDADGLIKSLGF